MKPVIFTGAAVALVTPFSADGSVNYEEFARLIDFQIENGTDALVIAGTTGESSTLSEQEHIDVIRFAVEHTNHRVPVIAGTGSNATATAVMLSQEAEKAGADALLLVTPYYNKTSQRGLYVHYKTIAESTKLPIILYNVPSRTGLGIDVETAAKLAEISNIVAMKDAVGNITYTANLIERCGDQLTVYSGNDDQIVPMMSLGAKGVISVLSNVAPKETHDMTAAALAGDFKTAAALQLKYLKLIHALFIETNPIPVKEAVNQMGYAAGSCRLPLYEMADNNKAVLVEEMKKQGLI
ncbi:MAG: 4-hydroxy-tetrahydrodipicolinate synthase [Oscillospiraceae bacterium]|nr:4-hydroxy-tetrahydrodipicolinate synthase [Oscillospiraceae bacterium]MCR4761400.1 4-hydroxy-tetrahydrodipicolinate synthase [Oscillospiraceae bacterium]